MTVYGLLRRDPVIILGQAPGLIVYVRNLILIHRHDADAGEQRKTLLQIARDSIAAALDGRRPDLNQYPIDDTLRRPAGAFVTLNDDLGQLRGCIGSIQPVAPLYQAVSSSAISAALRDPRFYPVKPDELPKLHLEISVMGPIEPVKDVSEIEVGRDGLIISRAAPTPACFCRRSRANTGGTWRPS